MPPLPRRRLLALLALAPLAACGASGAVRPGTTLVILRHADRSGDELSEAGRARAALLPGALADLPVDAIYAPEIQRNLDTAAPLAAARGQGVRVITTRGIAARLTAAHPGGTVVWVGNRDNLVRLWLELGAPGLPPLEYGEIAVVETTAEEPRVRRLRFGA